jgi:PHP family Zn ribbon phosphoesterase
MARSRRGRGGRTQQPRDAQEMTWFRTDLHVHTPASADYQDLDATYLHILQKAEGRGLDIIALTDHNTVSGIATMRREIEDLELLEQLGRLSTEEYKLLEEYRRVLTNVLVLPGFEFSAAFGFHILGIFPPETSIRKLEHILMLLNVPEEQMEMGSSQVGATADVLTAYEIISEQGGLVIPAHVDAPHGVAMQGARYGGQTKIAYTQSPFIHALEVTDLEDMSRRSTAAFFNGAKPEYPRRMHCIQASDAHLVTREGARRESDLGVGDRATEVLLPTRTFAALKELFESDDFARTRPYQPVVATPYDPIQAAREQGPTIVQAFHEQVRSRRSRYRPILKDVVAFANTNGGTIYVGMSASPQQPVAGVGNADDAARGVREAIGRSVVPSLDVTVDVESSGGKPVLVISVPKGLNTPYATDAGQVFVRQVNQTVVALRDEIVQLVREAVASEPTNYAGGTERERIWSAPRTITDLDEDGAEQDDADEAGAEAEPVLTAHVVDTEAHEPPRETRRPRRRRPRTRAEAPIDTAPDEQPNDAEADRVTAALDLAAGLPTEADSLAEIAPVEAETPVAMPALPVEPPTVAEALPPAPQPETHPEEPTDSQAAPAAEKRPRRRTRKPQPPRAAEPPAEEPSRSPDAVATSGDTPAENQPAAGSPAAPETPTAPPKSGIENLSVADQDGEHRYTMRDLHSGRVVENMSRKSARRLWRQAIVEQENGLPAPEAIRWHGNLGVWGGTTRDGVRTYNVAYRDNQTNGTIRYFFAVNEDGIDEELRERAPTEG